MGITGPPVQAHACSIAAAACRYRTVVLLEKLQGRRAPLKTKKATAAKHETKKTTNHSSQTFAVRVEAAPAFRLQLSRRRRLLDGTSSKLISSRPISTPTPPRLDASTALLFIANTMVNRFVGLFRVLVWPERALTGALRYRIEVIRWIGRARKGEARPQVRVAVD